ncbi:hypothetical protein EW146_g10423 [Bondarzewia mesenterica]|uniref:POLO box domain-containing protein n=1 Tax=Bondarzewia mesenterica TaxID=1095465 RepID=A0A4V3XBW4_9AGAM|nr:hypothetical protein EW146_g10423 [Bondarzewia mesenterica]
MSNEPLADIEILLDTVQTCKQSTDQRKLKRAEENSTAGMRIRLSRKRRTLEFSTFVATATRSTGEWNKKILVWTGGTSGASIQDLASLTDSEKEGMVALVNFVQVAEAFEALGTLKTSLQPDESPSAPNVSSGQTAAAASSSNRPASQEAILDRPIVPKKGLVRILSNPYSYGGEITRATSADATAGTETPSKRSFSDVNITPRPTLSPPLARFSDETVRRASSTVVEDGFHRHPSRASSPDSRPQSAASIKPEWPTTSPLGLAMQTRFITSVGWCIRYGTSGGGRYRIMFLDGIALEVDVDEERVEYVGKNGVVERYSVRECHSQRMVGERMKVFDEFVSLFDESSTE